MLIRTDSPLQINPHQLRLRSLKHRGITVEARDIANNRQSWTEEAIVQKIAECPNELVPVVLADGKQSRLMATVAWALLIESALA